MKAAFYAGATGLIAQQEALNTIGNNIANANTNGFKSQGVSFDDLLYTQMYANAPSDPLTGHGVRAVSTGIRMGQAPLANTDSPLDFAITGDGFFAVQSGNQVQYTRDGAFAINLEGGSAYLSTASGDYVLGTDGRRISLDQKKDEEAYDYNQLGGEIGVFRFDHPSALEPVSHNRYAPTEFSGAAMRADEETNQLLQFSLERSGTSMPDELTDMIAVQRTFQICARVVQVADENEQTINSLRK